jgi:hypothetical protein
MAREFRTFGTVSNATQTAAPIKATGTVATAPSPTHVSFNAAVRAAAAAQEKK